MTNFYNSNFSFKRMMITTSIVILMVVSSCEIDSFTEEIELGENNPPPTISGVTLLDESEEMITATDTIPVFRTFNVRVNASDDSPALSFAFLEIVNDGGEVVFSSQSALEGIEDAATFEIVADTIPRGDDYTARLRIQDTEGAETISEISFFGRAPRSVNSAMFLLGTFNGFGGTDRQMMLVDEYTWQFFGDISSDDQFKFVNTPDFSDSDWGDAECDNQAEPGNLDNNIACGFSGESLFTFNDLTLEYSVIPGDGSFNSRFGNVFIIGNFTGWGNDNADLSVPMELIGNNTWQAVVDAATPIDGAFDPNNDDAIFKFFGGPSFEPNPDLGDNEPDFIADDFGANINAGPPAEYTITLNDISLEYSIRSNFASNFDEIFVIGNFTGWGNDNADLSVPMRLVGDNSWEADIDATMDIDGAFNSAADNIIFKFFGGPSFEPNPDFGDNEQDGVVEDSGGNIDPGLPSGNYVIRLNDETREYSVEEN